MPSSITILCQIKSKGLDGGFVTGLAHYMSEPGVFKTFHYGYFKKQLSPLFLHDLQVGDHGLLCGKFVFNRGNIYVLVSAAFKIPTSENHDNINLPYGSFVGRIYEEVEQNGSDCKFGVNLLEYNNFSFASKEKINFRIHIVYEAGPNSRFIKLASRLQVGKLIFISGFFDLNENEIPFVEAKEIDILNEFSDNPSQTQSNNTLQSPFSRTAKFKSSKKFLHSSQQKANKTIEIIDNDDQIDDKSEEELPHAKFKSNKKLLQSPPQKKNKTIEIIDNDEQIDNKSEEEQKSPITSASKIEAKDSSISEKSTKKNSKRKMELSDLSIQRLEKAAKNTKVKTRSQKRYENQKEDNVLMEAEEST
ncbi:unnamed protein product [Rhizophagus irregularis]|uniref:Uncharacterized protein n=1 Tax=Rhizophagus irregularis TaxID=588596 RepID=A0A2I1EIX7_9GLOM|nr:hypothetical protein RhiirB3_470685 [Rhizophagus irregularis]CAB5313954.1 unnamed protein product [Rhizophagus irregularis]